MYINSGWHGLDMWKLWWGVACQNFPAWKHVQIKKGWAVKEGMDTG